MKLSSGVMRTVTAGQDSQACPWQAEDRRAKWPKPGQDRTSFCRMLPKFFFRRNLKARLSSQSAPILPSSEDMLDNGSLQFPSQGDMEDQRNS